MDNLWGAARSWIFSGCVVAGALMAALAVHAILFWLADKFTLKRGTFIKHALAKNYRAPARVILPLFALFEAVPFLRVPQEIKEGLQHTFELGVIASIGWGFVILARVTTDIIFSRYSIDMPDNLSARRVRTQTQVLQRIVVVLVAMVTLAVMLMTFPSVRHIGASVLASAGLAGLVAGMAARPTLSSLIAGIQVAITQPIRIDDAVIVENEWGWIEEIETTYVVVRLWDLRRMILPLTYFIEKPFQNWTRTTADLLASCMLYADYSLPVEELRQELFRVLQGTKLWDGKMWALQVTDLTEKSMQVRALMSASSASIAFDLRCHVREQLVHFLQKKYPQCLPRAREEQSTTRVA